jgi:enoyl-CoA hydratase
MTAAALRITCDAGIALLRIERPPANAIELASLHEMEEALCELERRADVRALVLTGAGSCFSAGLDLKAVPSYGPEEQRETVRAIDRTLTRLYGLPIPTVAAVNGHAIAGGLVFALACDQRIGTRAPCRIGLTEARAGIPFPAVAMAVVKAELPAPAARRLVLAARNYGPEEALADGVLDELAEPEALLERARSVAGELAAIPPEAYARIKEQLRAETLAFCRHVAQTGQDPLADAWLGAGTRAASAALLRGPRG